MKIAFISQPTDHFIPPVQGGSLTIWTYQVARRYAHKADILIYSRKAPNQPRAQEKEGIHYRRVSAALEDRLLKPLKLLERLSGHRNPKRPLFASPWYYIGYILQVANDLRSQQPDVVHIFNYSQFVPIVRRACPKSKIVLHMHCEWLTQLDRAMIERRLKKVDLIISCSHYSTKRIRQHFPKFAHRCETVLNGVDAGSFASQDGHRRVKKASPEGRGNEAGTLPSPKRLLFVGRVSPEKGVHVLLDAFEKVIAHYPHVHLDIVGPGGNAPFEFMVLISDDEKVSSLASFYDGILRRGDYFSDLQNALSAKLASHLTFVGPVPHSRIASYYREADILINPSFSEAFGMSLIEAMASGTPVIATRVGGMTDIVEEGKNGLLVEADNATALAEAILGLLKDDELRHSMGQLGRQQANTRYSWELIAEQLFNQFTLLYQLEK
jgi:glycosyltransferase involved in cell wall biosynthesis